MLIYLLLTPHFILWLKNGNKVLFETISTREKGKQFLNELEKKGPNTDNVGKIVVNINTTMDDYDEPLSEFRKLRNLKNEINREFPKND